MLPLSFLLCLLFLLGKFNLFFQLTSYSNWVILLMVHGIVVLYSFLTESIYATCCFVAPSVEERKNRWELLNGKGSSFFWFSSTLWIVFYERLLWIAGFQGLNINGRRGWQLTKNLWWWMNCFLLVLSWLGIFWIKPFVLKTY